MKTPDLDPATMADDPTMCAAVYPFEGAQVSGHWRPSRFVETSMALNVSAGAGVVSSSVLLSTDNARDLAADLVRMADAVDATRAIIDARRETP